MYCFTGDDVPDCLLDLSSCRQRIHQAKKASITQTSQCIYVIVLFVQGQIERPIEINMLTRYFIMCTMTVSSSPPFAFKTV